MENTEIAVLNQDSLASLSQNASAVLTNNRQSVDKAKAALQTFLDKAKGSEMNETLDAEAKKLVEKIKKTVKILNDRRKPVTQLLTAVSKEFTGLEAELGTKNELLAEVQKLRDGFASKKLEEQRKKDEEARRKLEKEKEIAGLKETIEVQLGNWFTEKLNATLNELESIFKQLTLINEKGIVTGIKNVPSEYPHTHFIAFRVKNVTTQYLTIEEKKKIKEEVLKGKFEKFSEQFKYEITEYKLELSERIPEKLQELQAIAEAEKQDTEKAARLKAEAKAKAKVEAEAKAKAEAIRKKKLEEEAARNKAEAEMVALVDASTMSATTESAENKVKTSLEIEVKHVAAFVQIFQFWFEREGQNLTIEQFKKKTIKQMISFAEKTANSDGDVIGSKMLKYNEVVKAK